MHPGIAVPATLALMYRAAKHKSLTPLGIATAAATAVAHAYHPWNLPFVLLCVFYLLGSRATKVKHHVKATLTLQAKGDSGGEGPRTHVQVLANSIMATIFTLFHARQLSVRSEHLLDPSVANPTGALCYNPTQDLILLGVIGNYAAVTADTLSSELGILSKSSPRLITSFLLKSVPRGTNGGVSILGLVAGFGGALVIGTMSSLILPFCAAPAFTVVDRVKFAGAIGIWGLLGSLFDSILGALFQQTVRDVRTGKVVEGEGGVRVLVSGVNLALVKQDVTKVADDRVLEKDGEGDALKGKPSREVVTGWDLLDNNEVNFVMAVVMSGCAILMGRHAFGGSLDVMDVLFLKG